MVFMKCQSSSTLLAAPRTSDFASRSSSLRPLLLPRLCAVSAKSVFRASSAVSQGSRAVHLYCGFILVVYTGQ